MRDDSPRCLTTVKLFVKVIYKASWVELTISTRNTPNDSDAIIGILKGEGKVGFRLKASLIRHLLGQSGLLCYWITLCLIFKTNPLYYSKYFDDSLEFNEILCFRVTVIMAMMPGHLLIFSCHLGAHSFELEMLTLRRCSKSAEAS